MHVYTPKSRSPVASPKPESRGFRNTPFRPFFRRCDANIYSAMTFKFASALLAFVIASACPRPAARQADDAYDLVIAGGSVINGEGTPAIRADLGIRGGRIATIGDLRTATATRRIDA